MGANDKFTPPEAINKNGQLSSIESQKQTTTTPFVPSRNISDN